MTRGAKGDQVAKFQPQSWSIHQRLDVMNLSRSRDSTVTLTELTKEIVTPQSLFPDALPAEIITTSIAIQPTILYLRGCGPIERFVGGTVVLWWLN